MTTPTAPEFETGTGGERSTRKRVTREAIADAFLDLMHEGNLRPTAREIAQRAGISLRSVYVHFEDLDDLFCAAADRHFNRVAPLLQRLSNEGDLTTRAHRFAARRIQLFTYIAGVLRGALLHAPFSPTLNGILAGGYERSRLDIAWVFKAELSQLDETAHKETMAALDVVASFPAYESHLGVYGFDAGTIARIMARSVIAILEHNA